MRRYQNQLRSATKDIEAIVTQFRSNQLTQTQVASAIRSFEEHYGGLAYRVPAYQELAGVRDDALRQQDQLLTSFAADRGLDRRFVRWDDRTGKPEYNTEEFAVADKQREWQAHRTKLAASNADAIAEQARVIADSIHQQERLAGLDPKTGKYNPALGAGKAQSYLYQQLQILQNAQQDALLDVRRELNTAQQPTVRHEYKQMATTPEQNAPAVVNAATTAATPAPAQNVTYPTFASQSDVLSALQSGRLKKGEAFIFNGKRVAVVGNKVVPQ